MGRRVAKIDQSVLFPCPLCGGKAELCDILHIMGDQQHFIVCLGCELNTKAINSLDELVTYWNQRHPPDQLRLEAEQKRDELRKTVEELYKFINNLADTMDAWTIAAEEGYLDVIKLLAKYSTDVHTYINRTFVNASYYGQLEIIKYLVEQGADVHANDDNAFRWASEYGRFEVVKYLVENGANIHACDDYALRHASANGHLKTVKYLVKHGADIHALDDQALNWANTYENTKVVKYLEGLTK